MQRSWREDGDKLTFVICRPFEFDHGSTTTTTSYSDESTASHKRTHKASSEDIEAEVAAMVGDVNLFISTLDSPNDSDETLESSDKSVSNSPSPPSSVLPGVVGELELMIADRAHRRKGLGKASLLAFLKYIVQHEREILEEYFAFQQRQHRALNILLRAETKDERWKFSHFSVKIAASNTESLGLFEGLGFVRTSGQPSYFGEFELCLARGVVEGSDWVGVTGFRAKQTDREN